MNAKALPTIYRNVRFRSRLEAEWARHLDGLGRNGWRYEGERFMGATDDYLPDLWFDASPRFYIEVKSQKDNYEAALRKMHLILDTHTDADLTVGTARWNGSNYDSFRLVAKCRNDEPCGAHWCSRSSGIGRLRAAFSEGGAKTARAALAASRASKPPPPPPPRPIRKCATCGASEGVMPGTWQCYGCIYVDEQFAELDQLARVWGEYLEVTTNIGKDAYRRVNATINKSLKVKSRRDAKVSDVRDYIGYLREHLKKLGLNPEAEDPIGQWAIVHERCAKCHDDQAAELMPEPTLCRSCWDESFTMCWDCNAQGIDRHQSDTDPICEDCWERQTAAL